ncbi:hypothetical protein F2Q68_00012952 [Brassica cretica]|uniref:Uncharacterized protein n=1 Tax=Brassica cretica TaxID=69181 RepID=A0A8S9HDC9_BRACR|nr:hypothetical protein F2Q68_00012952 [Brassica cretica]
MNHWKREKAMPTTAQTGTRISVQSSGRKADATIEDKLARERERDNNKNRERERWEVIR